MGHTFKRHLSYSIKFLSGCSLGAEAISVAALPLYFDKFYDLANGIAHTGISTGLMLLPPLTQYLLDTYGWRGAFLILGGLNLNLIVCGMLLRPIQTKKSFLISNVEKNYQSVNSGSSLEQEELEIPTRDSNSLELSIKDRLDLDLLFNFDFITLLCIAAATGYFFTGWVVYFVPHLLVYGFKSRQAAFLATIGGVGNLVGTLAFPVSTRYLSGKVVLYIGALIAAVGLAIDPAMSILQSHCGMMISSFLVNVGFALTDCGIFKEVVNVVEEQKFATAFNWMFVMYSAGALSSGFLSGKLFD